MAIKSDIHKSLKDSETRIFHIVKENTSKIYTYRHLLLLHISSLSVQSCPISVLDLLRRFSGSYSPRHMESLGTSGALPPVQLSLVQQYHTRPPLPQPFSFEGGSATSRGRKPSGSHSPMLRGMSRGGPSPVTTVERA